MRTRPQTRAGGGRAAWCWVLGLGVGWTISAGAIPGRADVVLDWNRVALEAIRAQNAAPTLGSRTLAMLHLAIYDAINSILGSHESFRFNVPPPDGALPEAAALAAGYHVLSVLCPTEQAIFDTQYAFSLADLAPGPDREAGLRVGQEVAFLMLDWRAADGATTDVPYIPSPSPGAWRRTAPDFRPPRKGCEPTLHFPDPPAFHTFSRNPWIRSDAGARRGSPFSGRSR